MHDEERPALEQAPEEDLDLEGAETTVLSTPYGEATGVRRPPALNAPTPDAAAGDAPAPAVASADDIVADVVALTPDYAVSADAASDFAALAPDDGAPDFAVSADAAADPVAPAPDDAAAAPEPIAGDAPAPGDAAGLASIPAAADAVVRRPDRKSVV
mgnify:CR=1 FL=1